MVVSCLADGVQVKIGLSEADFNGVLYVKGHSKDEECRRVIDTSSPKQETFKVNFGSCGLFHVNGVASFVLVIQKHPKLVTYKAQAYHIRCVYQTGEKNVTLGFNVQMLTTAGTIANTGPPPQCSMRIVQSNGKEINSAEIGDNLMLQVEVQPSSKGHHVSFVKI
jgi:Zona pellucida-like domain